MASTHSNLPVLSDDLSEYMAEIRRFPLLSAKEEYDLAKDWQNTGSVLAAHRLVTANLRFVVKIASEYRGYGLKLIELVQEGNVGLMQAVKRFDPDRGYRLISYAVHWIRAYIHQYIMRSLSMVRMGVGRAQRKLFYKLGEIRSLMDKECEERDSARSELAKKLKVDIAEVTELENRLLAPDLFLDAPLSDDDDSTIGSTLGDGKSLEEAVIKDDLAEQSRSSLAEALKTLSERERAIIEARYLSDDPPALQTLGEAYGISRERVRQLEARALGKLRKALGVNEAAPALAALC